MRRKRAGPWKLGRGKSMRLAKVWMRDGLVLAGLLGLLAGVGAGQLQPPGFGQGGQTPGAQQGGRGSQDPFGDNSPTRKNMEEKQVQARNDDRQKRLIADSDKLLALATELHDEVQKTDKNILSVEVVKKATEMEKLSRDLKERMRG